MTVGNHVSISDYEDSSWGSGYQKGKLGLTKSGAFARVEDDNTIKWTVTVNNNPTKTVNGDIQFKDVLPEGLEYIAGSISNYFFLSLFQTPPYHGNRTESFLWLSRRTAP